MGFLAPFFLLGGFLVALPILLHLTRRRREPVDFPSFFFLEATRAPASWKRRRFRNLPLLILRCLALALLAAAFARPLLRGGALADAARQPLDLAVLVDRSASMGISGRAEEAAAIAAAAIGELGSDDRAVVLGFADRPVALTRLTGERAELEAALPGVAPGTGGTRIAPALGLAGRLLPETPGRRREALLISDLQRSGFEGRGPEPSLPRGIALRVRRVGSDPPANAAVTAVELSPERGEGAARLRVRAEIRFAPSARSPEREVEAELVLGGRVVERRPVRLSGDRAAPVVFSPVLRPSESVAAAVRLPGDAFPGDDLLRFVIRPGAALRVADLGGGGDPVFVREALGVGAAPVFRLDPGPARGESRVRRALEGARVALLRDPGRLDAGAVRALAGFVAAGGGLVAAMGPTRIQGAAAAELEALLPALPGGFSDREPAGRFADFQARHPVFDPFAPEGPVALAQSAFFRYRTLETPAPDAEVLARFDDGAPALLSAGRGAGRILLFASAFDGVWNDLPRRPAFVPFLHRLIEVAAGHEEIPLAYRVGQSVDAERAFLLSAETATADPEAAILVEAPSGERTLLGAEAALRLEEAGRYRARRPEAPVSREIAVNLPAAESDLHPLDADEVRLAAAPPAAPAIGGAGAIGRETEPPEGAGFPVWWLLLGGLAVLLVAEAWVANRFGERQAPLAAGA